MDTRYLMACNRFSGDFSLGFDSCILFGRQGLHRYFCGRCSSDRYSWELQSADRAISMQDSTYEDLLLSPSLLRLSIAFNISLLPAAASTSLPAKLMLTFSPFCLLSSLFTNKCLIVRHTNTPQSQVLNCCGLSSRSLNSRSLPNNCPSLFDIRLPSRALAELRES